MAKNPDKPKKDPARPTRAKAAREPLTPIAPALEKLLNPGIAKGTAGVGSQTGLTGQGKPKARSGRLPTIRGTGARICPPHTGQGSRRGRRHKLRPPSPTLPLKGGGRAPCPG